MARLKKKFFGNISGAFGDAVFRQVGDKNYIAQRPSGYKIPDTQEYKDRTTKFGLSIKIAKLIYRIPELKYFWQNEFPNDSRIFNLIVRSNYSFITPDGISSTPHLTPQGNGFGVSVNNLSVTQSAIDLEIAPLINVSVINPDIDKKIRLQSLLLLATPTDNRLVEFAFLTMQSADLNLSVTDPINFSLVPSQNQSEMIGNYSQKKAFFTVITLDESNKPINHSSTFYNN